MTEQNFKPESESFELGSMTSFDIASNLYDGSTYSRHDKDIAVVTLVGLADGHLFGPTPAVDITAAQLELVKRAATNLGLIVTGEDRT